MTIQNQSNTNDKNLELLKPKNDVIFTSLFTQKNERITKSFISALLNEKINKITINDTKELFRENPNDKLGILDLEAEINNNEVIDVEIQILDKHNLAERMLFYFSKLYSKQIHKGDNYLNAKRTVIIAIIDYSLDLTKEISKMETKWNLREEDYKEIILTSKIEFIILELNKVLEEYNKNKENLKTQWMMFLNDPNSSEVKNIMENNKDIEEATVEIRKMSEDEKLRKLAELRLKAVMDEKSAYHAGMEDGEKTGFEKRH